MRNLGALALGLSLTTSNGFADSLGEPGRDSRKANPLKNAYFGEQHLHTQQSPAAFSMGTRNSIDDAYNFCKGKAIKMVPATLQERAWASPIWYTPDASLVKKAFSYPGLCDYLPE
jgi:hypothetical protein